MVFSIIVCCKAVRSAITETAWLLVKLRSELAAENKVATSQPW